MKFLLFADLHQFEPQLLNQIDQDFDVIILLGDINSVACKCILNAFPDYPIYGLYGNHDNVNLFESVNNILMIERQIRGQVFCHPIKNINLEQIIMNEVSFTGLHGSVKYSGSSVGYTQDEALHINIPASNILFSHETGYHYIPEHTDHAHEGYKVIAEYIEQKKPKYHIFGHHHVDIQFTKTETMCYGIYGCSIFDTQTGIMMKIF